MDQHLADYNYIISLLPEMAIWNKIILLLDEETTDKLYQVFPILKLFSDYACMPEYIGMFTITETLLATSVNGDMITLGKEIIPVYKVIYPHKLIRRISMQRYLLINDERLFMVDLTSEKVNIYMFHDKNRIHRYSADDFITVIEKYRNMTEGFFMLVDKFLYHELSLTFISKNELFDKLTSHIPIHSPITKCLVSEVTSLYGDLSVLHASVKLNHKGNKLN